MMQLSKIGSKNTYHKCLKELHQAGYIYHHPPPAKYIPVKISIVRLDTKEEEKTFEQLDLFSSQIDTLAGSEIEDLVCPKNGTHNEADTCPKSGTYKRAENECSICPKNGTAHVPYLTATCPTFGTACVPNMGHLIKHINYKHKREENAHEKKFAKNDVLEEKENVSPRVPNMGHVVPEIMSEEIPMTRPALSEVEEFFLQNNYPVQEAQKFFHHYQSNGWLIGGKSPMINWQSSASKWMLNTISKPNQTNPHDLNTQSDKNYSQPL